MRSFFSRVFSDRYANHDAIGHNLLLMAMYRFAFPFACAFNALGLTPNKLTALSCMSAVAAAAALALHKAAWLYVFLWGLSVLFDFCDGTVARMSGRLSSNAFRFDHMSDLAKVSAVVIAAGWRYQDNAIWLCVCVTLFAFLYYSVINQELKAVRLLLLASSSDEKNSSVHGFQTRLPLTIRVVYAALATVNGHSLLVLLALPFNRLSVVLSLLYLASVSLYGVLIRIRILLSLPKPSKR